MIRINLLEVREERRRIAIRNLLAVSGLSLFLTVAFVFSWHQGILSDIEFEEKTIADTKQEIKRLEGIVGEVEKIKGTKQDLEQKLDVIKSLESNRAEIVDLLLAIAEILAEEIWLTRVDVVGRHIEVEASSTDMQSIGALVKNIKEDPRFINPRTSDIKVASGSAKGGEGGHVGFKLSIDFVPPQQIAPIAEQSK